MIGIVLMSYGSPISLDKTSEFFKHILQGKEPSEQQIAKVQEMYRSLGTYDLLRTVTERQAEALDKLLQSSFSEEIRVYAGFKHCSPFVEDIVKSLVEEKASCIVALPLVPFYSKTGVESYLQNVRQSLEVLNSDAKLVEITDWHQHEQLVSVIAKRVKAGLEWLGSQDEKSFSVLFTAHSQRGNRETHQVYDSQFRQLAEAVAKKLNVTNYQIAYRSAGPNRDIWLGPFVEDVIRQEKEKGIEGIVVCELMALVENGEVIKDIGHKLQSFVESEGLKYVRTEFLNDSTDFMLALTNIVKEQIKTEMK